MQIFQKTVFLNGESNQLISGSGWVRAGTFGIRLNQALTENVAILNLELCLVMARDGAETEPEPEPEPEPETESEPEPEPE